MELLGHSQMRTTMDIYSHVMPALAREAADRKGALLLPGKGGRAAINTATRAAQAALPWDIDLIIGVELRGPEPLTPTLPGGRKGVMDVRRSAFTQARPLLARRRPTANDPEQCA
jgi:hypothetical protein